MLKISVKKINVLNILAHEKIVIKPTEHRKWHFRE